MKYAVDKIIDDIVTLENIETKEIKNISIDKLPNNIKEGQIVIEKEIYELDIEEEDKRRKEINRKLNKLKNK